MFLFKLLRSIAVCFALLFVTHHNALADTLRSTERSIVVEYTHGFEEKYVATYNGIVNVSMEEREGPAKPLDGQDLDNRQCFWSIQTFVQRQIFAIDMQGQRTILEQFNDRFETNFANKGSDFSVRKLRPESCGDAQSSFESDVGNAHRAIQNQFEDIVTSDLPSLKAIFNQAESVEIR
jgi:hypothetical protein